LARLAVVGEQLFKSRSGGAEANNFCKLAKIQPFTFRIGRPQKTLQPAAQAGGADQEWFAAVLDWFDQAHRRLFRQEGEKMGVFGGIEFQDCVEFQHKVSILEARQKCRKRGEQKRERKLFLGFL
jgi:hypothetical protein